MQQRPKQILNIPPLCLCLESA